MNYNQNAVDTAISLLASLYTEQQRCYAES